MSTANNKYLLQFKALLILKKIKVRLENDGIVCSAKNKTLKFAITNSEKRGIPFDLIVTMPEKIGNIILSKLNLNKTVFARNCEVKKVERKEAEQFLEKYHIMNSTQSAYNLGLFYKDELLALASFSKGRKMNRLPENKRSFELIRFCCKEGITVTGGLTKLVKNFCREKKAGDVMTYVDKQFSLGDSFIKAGFVKLGETEPNYFLVNRKTYERISVKTKPQKFDEGVFYLGHNSGNIKLVYTPNE